jgi:hypothetical protein
MTLLWFFTGASLIAAFVAWRQARRNAKRLEQLSQMYWELKYQQGELRVLMRRLGGEADPSPAPPPPARPAEVFVPLSSIKKDRT